MGEDLQKQLIKIEAKGNDWVMGSLIASGPWDNNYKKHVDQLIGRVIPMRK
jgi:hypothetical protein